MTNKRDKQGWYKIAGINMRSVTTVLDYLEKKALHPWIAKTTALQIKDYILDPIIKGEMTAVQLSEMDMKLLMDNAKKAHELKKTEAADMGSLIHRVIEEYYKASSDPMILNNYTKTFPVLTAPILAFLDWQAKYKIVPMNAEHSVYSMSYLYAGTLDLECLATLPEAPETQAHLIVDFKSSSGIYDEHILQIAAYAQAQEEMSNKGLDGAMIVRLDKETGMPETHYFSRDDLQLPFSMFNQVNMYCQIRDTWKEWQKSKKKEAKNGSA